MAEVSLTGVRKVFGTLEVIKGIDLTVQDRELVVFVGPSGCGKSTLLRMIAGLEDVDYGTIRISGKDVTENAPANRGVAMVFQNYALYPHMSAYDNMAYGLRRSGLAAPEVDKRVRETAALLQITDLLPRRPKAMSGGQRQRVAIGRAIVRNPDVFLFDEPLSNLDAGLRVEMRSQIARLHRELQATMIFVTHDQVEAMTLANRIVILNHGRIEQTGTPLDLYVNPANRFVAGFLGSPRMNFFEARVVGQSDHGLDVRVVGPVNGPVRFTVPLTTQVLPTQGLTAGTIVTLGLRPEHIHLGAAPVQVGASIRLYEQLGRDTVLYADADGLKCTHSEGGQGSFTVQLNQPLPVELGQRVQIGFDPALAYVFGVDGTCLSPKRAVLASKTD